jgi:hypothetical protein
MQYFRAADRASLARLGFSKKPWSVWPALPLLVRAWAHGDEQGNQRSSDSDRLEKGKRYGRVNAMAG